VLVLRFSSACSDMNRSFGHRWGPSFGDFLARRIVPMRDRSENNFRPLSLPQTESG
jgi:hypothetical protein